MRLCVLSSGSGGNCVFVGAADVRVLVDAGLSFRETRRRCAEVGLDARDLTDIVLTHEHGDHACGAAGIARKTGARVHATLGTFRALRDPPPPELQFALPGSADDAYRDLVIGTLRIRALPVPHDAEEPVAYVFEERCGSPSADVADRAAGERAACREVRPVRIAVVTDLGWVPRSLALGLKDLDALVLEMNHDPALLAAGPYPPSLKRRVLSDVGHLSNEQGACLLRHAAHQGLRHVVLAHLSAPNNTPDHARRAAERALEPRAGRASLLVGSQMRPLPPVEIRADAVRLVPRPHQLALFG